MFHLTKQNLQEFLDDSHWIAKNASGAEAQTTDQLTYA